MTEATGYQRSNDEHADLNADTFTIKQLIGRIGTMLPVRVLSCTNAGGLAPVGKVDVQSLVDQHDGAGNSVPHGPLHNLPYVRVQGGTKAVIIDPEPGDIGLAFFAQRDISAVKAVGGQNVRGSRRRHDMADGCYMGGILNAVPTEYVRFGPDGITVHSESKITVDAPSIALTGSSLTHNGVNIGATHKHKGVQQGNSNTDVPVS